MVWGIISISRTRCPGPMISRLYARVEGTVGVGRPPEGSSAHFRRADIGYRFEIRECPNLIMYDEAAQNT